MKFRITDYLNLAYCQPLCYLRDSEILHVFFAHSYLDISLPLEYRETEITESGFLNNFICFVSIVYRKVATDTGEFKSHVDLVSSFPYRALVVHQCWFRF